MLDAGKFNSVIVFRNKLLLTYYCGEIYCGERFNDL